MLVITQSQDAPEGSIETDDPGEHQPDELTRFPTDEPDLAILRGPLTRRERDLSPSIKRLTCWATGNVS